jgi:hypothetical protein
MTKGKVLTEARSTQKQLTRDRVELKQGEPAFLWGITSEEKTYKQHPCRDLYRCLNEELIYHANIQRLVARLNSKQYRARFALKELRP